MRWDCAGLLLRDVRSSLPGWYPGAHKSHSRVVRDYDGTPMPKEPADVSDTRIIQNSLLILCTEPCLALVSLQHL